MKKLLIFMVLSLLLVSCGKNENPDVVSDNKENQEVSMNSENIDKKIIEEKNEKMIEEVNNEEKIVEVNNEEDNSVIGNGNEIIEEEKEYLKNEIKKKSSYKLSGYELELINIDEHENYQNKLELFDKIIYFDNEEELKNYSDLGCGMYLDELKSTPNCFNYKQGTGTLIEINNIRKRERKGFGSRIGDIYENGNLLVNNFPFGCWDGCEWPVYDKKNGVVIVNEGRGDVCSGFNTKTKYDLNKKEYSSYTVNSDSCFVDNRSISFGEGEKNIIDIYDHKKDNSNFNSYSVFSITKGEFKRNYIYNSNLKFETKEDFMNAGNNITYFLGGKEFKINFDELEKSKDKMDFLYGGGQKYFDYGIYLKKQGNNYTIFFDYIETIFGGSYKKIKNIGIISCKSNFSKEYDSEYILKTKDEHGNYKYNISEKFDNKCDIPYKINVYYEDGTRETGEYYILF